MGMHYLRLLQTPVRRPSAWQPYPTSASPCLSETIEDQLVRADLILTTGGISYGSGDTVREVLGALGTVRFDNVAASSACPVIQSRLRFASRSTFVLPCATCRDGPPSTAPQ